MKRKLRRLRIRIVRTITYIAGVMIWLSAMALDSDSWIPLYVFIGCMVWLTLVGIANERSFSHEAKDKTDQKAA